MSNQDEKYEHLDPKEYTEPAEKEFIAALKQRAKDWEGLGIGPDEIREVPIEYRMRSEGGAIPAWKVVVGFMIVDEEDNYLETFRVDYSDGLVAVGRDETSGSLDADLDSSRPEYAEYRHPSPRACAEFAAMQIERQLRRPVECHEWHGPGFRHKRWLFSDTGEGLAFCDTDCEPRSNLGPPDRIRVVRDFRTK
jgi:hypothetical protein